MHIHLSKWQFDALFIKSKLDPLIQSPSGGPVVFRAYPGPQSQNHAVCGQLVYKNLYSRIPFAFFRSEL